MYYHRQLVNIISSRKNTPRTREANSMKIVFHFGASHRRRISRTKKELSWSSACGHFYFDGEREKFEALF
jgi:hypothetical protein